MTVIHRNSLTRRLALSALSLAAAATAGGCSGTIYDKSLFTDWGQVQTTTASLEDESRTAAGQADTEESRTADLGRRRDALRRDVKDLKFELDLLQQQVASLGGRKLPQDKADDVRRKANALKLQGDDLVKSAAETAAEVTAKQERVAQLHTQIKNLKDDIEVLMSTAGR